MIAFLFDVGFVIACVLVGLMLFWLIVKLVLMNVPASESLRMEALHMCRDDEDALAIVMPVLAFQRASINAVTVAKLKAISVVLKKEIAVNQLRADQPKSCIS